MLQAPNKADNIIIADAAKFCAKLNELGFRLGPLHINETVSGEAVAAIAPIESFEGLEADKPYNVVAWAGGDWHNIAQLVRMWGAGTAQDFREVFTDIYPGADANAGLLNIPGATKAIEKIIQKAGQ